MEKLEARSQELPVANVTDPSSHLTEEVSNRLVIYVTRPEEVQNCHFWVGLFRPGNLRAPDLVSLATLDEIYQKAASDGLSDHEPILIANTSILPAKGYYFLPAPTDQSEYDASKLVALIERTIKAVKPRRVGFYFSPDLMNKSLAEELLKLALMKIRKTEAKEYYLYVGSLGVNTVLNMALEVKAMLSDQHEVIVFH